MRKKYLIFLAGLCVALSSVSMCWAADKGITENSDVAAIDLSSGRHLKKVQVEKWLNNIKPAAGVRQGSMSTSRTPYWKTTVNRRSRR